jgi:hypothetical protein
MCTLVLTRQELIDELADLKSEYQHARTCGNSEAMRSILEDMRYCEVLISNSPNNF